MPTIISRPAVPTFIVSTPNLQGTPHPVTSVHGRVGPVVGQDDDYDITQINPSGASDADVISVEAGRFVVKTPEISGAVILQSIPGAGDIVEFTGTNWVVTQPKISGNLIAAAGPEAGEVLTFDGSNWVNFDIFALVENSIDNNIAAHALLTDVHGLIDSGAGTLFLADDGVYKTVTHPPDAVSSVFGRGGVVIAAVGDYAIADITGLTTAGSPTDFLGADGVYKPIAHPPDVVTSVFGRTGVVIAVVGDYAIADITGLTTAGSPTDFLGADGVYKPITHPPDVVTSVFGRTGVVIAVGGDYAIADITGLTTAGGGTDFLADDGTYKSPAGRQIVGPTLADGTTISSGSAHTTIFDFAPDAIFRNNNCLLTIHYQARNVPGNAQWAAWLRTNIGLTVQQNAYNGSVAMDSNGDERLAFTVVMEGIVSATGNIEIEVRADGKDHDFSNSATSGKTRLTIELV